MAAWFAPSVTAQTRVVHLWASWCRPCAAELPRLLAALRSRRDRIDIVFLSLDGEASASKAAALLKKNGGVPGVSARANTPAALAAIRAFDPDWDGSLPTTFVVSPEGHLAVAQRGITELEPLLSELDRSEPVSTTHTASKE
jgi:thiol-disulfide isomerase/thioredoxin